MAAFDDIFKGMADSALKDRLNENEMAGGSIWGSVGLISDAFIFNTSPVSLLNGPIGSGKTTAVTKKILVEAIRVPEITRIDPDGQPYRVRRYVLGVVRETYKALWSTTIPAWWEVIPQKLEGTTWSGSRGYMAQHTIPFTHQWGISELILQFVAFGDQASPDEWRGWKFTDVWLNEMDLMPLALFEALSGRIARDPVRKLLRRPGRIYGDCNAPSILSWVFKYFWENPPSDFVLFRQPGAYEPSAENLENIGIEYYDDYVAKNEKKPWLIRRMVGNIPGVSHGDDLIYPEYDDTRHFSETTLKVYPEIPVIVGIDAQTTAAAVFQQELPDGQVRWLKEVTNDRIGERAFADQLAAAMALPRFKGCEFHFTCDPSANAGDDLDEGSWRSRVSGHLGAEIHAAETNDTSRRQEAVREPLSRNLDGGRPGFLLDPSCKVLRRGFLERYKWRRNRVTGDPTGVEKNYESHVHEGGQYAALKLGTAHSRHRRSALERERRQRRKEARQVGRYNPLAQRR